MKKAELLVVQKKSRYKMLNTARTEFVKIAI